MTETLMAARKRTWEIDWAGPHGTAWGTVNGILTPITVTWVGHLGERYWLVPVATMVLATATVTVLGVVATLARAALRKTRTPGVTVIYRVLCWTVAGGWSTHMVHTSTWTLRWWLGNVAALAVAGVVAGLLVGLAKDEPPSASADPAVISETPSVNAQQRRDSLAVEWEGRLRRVCDVEATVPNIEDWPRNNGYTVEAVVGEGGASWRTLAARSDDLAADLDLPRGCGVSVSMGVSRRAALIDVATVDALAEEQPYPDDYGDLSILDPLPFGVKGDGSVIGPALREKCMLLVGESGSGKTNAGHVVAAGVVRTTDALDWDIDLTGGGLSLPWLRAFLDGRCAQPAIDWAATDEQEAHWMLRAARRGGYARKANYQDLMRDHDDDKIPVGDDLPEVVIRVDEIAKITGQPSRFPNLNEGIEHVVFELRASAFRAVLLGLRATADVVGPDIQAQCHVIGVMRAKNDAEYAWAFGWHSGASVEDAPYPGCGFLSMESGAKPEPLKWWRQRPTQIEEIAIATDGRHPEMDEVTRLALNGRHPNGIPMDDLLPGELDCYDTRWDRFRAKYNLPAVTGQPAGVPAVATVPATGGDDASGDTPASPVEAMASLDQALKDLETAVAAAKASRGEAVPDSDEVTERLPVDDDAWAAVLAAWEADGDVPTTGPQTPSGDPPKDWPQRMLTVIARYGADGVGPGELLAVLADEEIEVHRDTLNEQLKAAIERGEVWKPRRGKYVRRWPA
jgi:hypothetical protein